MATYSSATGTDARTSRAMNVALWAAQVTLAVFFAYAGLAKIAQPISQLAGSFLWPADVPAALVRFIGISELSGALGLILPTVARMKPGLAPIAAIGLALIMVLAAIFHVARGELFALPTNIALGALAVFVAWGRLKIATITPRS